MAQSFHCIIDISDDDVSYKEIPTVEDVSGSRKRVEPSSKNSLQKANLQHVDEEHKEDFKFHAPNSRSLKRNTAAQIIDSDNESGYDDNVISSQVRIRLPDKKMPPSTPGVVQSPFHGAIDLSDDDVSYGGTPKVETKSSLRQSGGSVQEHIDEEHMDDLKSHSLNTGSAKRKKAAKIIISDDESSYVGNAPNCRLKTRRSSEVMTDLEDDEIEENASGRHHPKLRKSGSKNGQDKSSIDLYKSSSSDEEEDEESETEGESLDEFIVDSSESVSKCDSDSTDESEDASSEYQVERIGNIKWDLEGDMLFDFANDPELCMRAVCALYRRQTDDEKESKVTIHQNERGFSQADASWGSELAEFLMDGDPYGDLNKTVEELIEYDSKGIKRCKALAFKYSKQLFEIYQSKEDPYFLPQ